MTDPHLARVLADLDRLEPHARKLLQGLSDAQLAAAPPGGGWSIAQIFEHLCLADRSYVEGCLPGALEKARGREQKPWKPSLIGSWLRRALARTEKKLPAPKIFRVGETVREGVVECWIEGLQQLRTQIESAANCDLNTRLGSPVSRLIRLSLGDALAIPVAHAQRHLGQVARTREALGR